MTAIQTFFLILDDGSIAFIDEDDYRRLAQYRWTSVASGNTRYARATINGRREYLHRVIAGAKPGERVDHANGDGLDCTGGNLRPATHAENVRNSAGRASVRRSKYKGVSRGNGRMCGKWRAQIKIDGTQRHLGYFDSEDAAALAYNRAALEAFGDFARLNEIKT